MQRIFKNFMLSVMISIIFANLGFAIDNEYKNSLMKIEVTKKDDNAYSLNLYTQKRYVEPVKIIKKNDLSYYVLLPETKNSVSNVENSTPAVKNVTTNSYPYVGQEKNGYTKININTSKPVVFDVNIKSLSQARKNSLIEQEKNKKIAATSNTTKSLVQESQKKNLNTNKVANATTTPLPAIAKEKVSANNKNINSQKNTKQDIKTVKKATETKKISRLKKAVEKNIRTNKVAKKEIKETKKVAIVNESKADIQNNNEISEVSDLNQPQEEAVQNETIENIAPVEENIANNTKEEVSSTNSSKFLDTAVYYSKGLLNKASYYKKYIKYVIFAALVLSSMVVFLLILVMIFTSFKKKDSKFRDSLGLSQFKSGLAKNDGNDKKAKSDEYFILNDNIKNNLYKHNREMPTKKHYELSSYEPDIRVNYKKQYQDNDVHRQYGSKVSNYNEYDIIQKILKEDSLIEFEKDELNTINQTKEVNSVVVQKTAKKATVQKKVQKQAEEPVVLSSVEIAPERGFMCVSYNETINLIGYIFDDVFALYNFKQPKLENYDIKFRLTEKDDKGANFIVKVGKVKMLVRATKSFMSLEVLL